MIIKVMILLVNFSNQSKSFFVINFQVPWRSWLKLDQNVRVNYEFHSQKY